MTAISTTVNTAGPNQVASCSSALIYLPSHRFPFSFCVTQHQDWRLALRLSPHGLFSDHKQVEDQQNKYGIYQHTGENNPVAKLFPGFISHDDTFFSTRPELRLRQPTHATPGWAALTILSKEV